MLGSSRFFTFWFLIFPAVPSREALARLVLLWDKWGIHPSLPCSRWLADCADTFPKGWIHCLHCACIVEMLIRLSICSQCALPKSGAGRGKCSCHRNKLLQPCSDKSQRGFLLSQVPTRLANSREIIWGCPAPQELRIKCRVCDTVTESGSSSRNTNCSLLKWCVKGLERESRRQVLITDHNQM